MTAIPYARQQLEQSDIEKVAEVLRSDWLTQGPAVPRFESDLLRLCGAKHASAMSSGTAALHVACRALGLRPGDRAWTSPFTFAASANCARYCGADVDFVDIDPVTMNMSAEMLEGKLERAARDGTLPKILVVVHYAGRPCDMAKIHMLVRQYDVRIVEDAAHALGATYRGTPIGACQHSDAAVFSFHPVKHITTGEGGMMVTNDPEAAQRATLLRSHGITRDPALMSGPIHGPWYYELLDLGFNYRMTDIQAALGSSQLSRIAANLERRRAIAMRYREALRNLPLLLPCEDDASISAWHLYVVRLDERAAGCTRLEAFTRLRAVGIMVNVHYIPVHLHPYYRKLGFGEGMFLNAEQCYRQAISLPMFVGLGDEDQERVIEALRSVLS